MQGNKVDWQWRTDEPDTISGQSYNSSMIVIDDSRVVPDLKIPILRL